MKEEKQPKSLGRFVEHDNDPLNFVVGDEDVYSSLQDMAKWIRAWDEPLLVSRNTLYEAQTPQQLLNGSLGKAGLAGSLVYPEERRSCIKMAHGLGSETS